MEKNLRAVALVLLFFNGAGAIFGGSMLVYDPTGSALELPFDILKNSPFDSYLIPG